MVDGGMELSSPEAQLCEFLRDLPDRHKFRYGASASHALLEALFWSLAGGQDKHFRLFFPDGRRPPSEASWKLRQAQGAVDGAEYTEAARGKACGHIFKSGEATYRCKTCSSDDTCVLCSRCYDSSDHTGHMVYISISPGNSGCCDCGDPEAWRIPVHCTIHSEHLRSSQSAGKAPAAAPLPEELVERIRMTIGRAFDYICDVISCSPENLRHPKSKASIEEDERKSRLTSQYYRHDLIDEPEFALLLWNDEKHTVNEVRDQVARACKIRISEALEKAHETDDIGRTIVKYDKDIDKLLATAKVIEQIKVTVTIRSSRDTFREQMCGTIIEWLGDIAGCSVGDDHNILRLIVCEEMLKSWRTGSVANNAEIGKDGIDDQELDDRESSQQRWFHQAAVLRAARAAAANDSDDDESDGDADDDGGNEMEDDFDLDEEEPFLIEEVLDVLMAGGNNGDDEDDEDVEMGDDTLEASEATMAGYPPPPPPPPPPRQATGTQAAGFASILPPPPPPPPGPSQLPHRPHARPERELTPSDSDTAEPLIPPSVYAKVNIDVPRTPGPKTVTARSAQKPPRYWLTTPEAYQGEENVPLHEDLFQRVRLDWMILFDLRMWKKVRIDLRDLYISTVVTIPQFKRVLGLRFAGLYTLLAQLYLIADREPDHSIINISLQMLTTPSITTEIVERGNFLTNLMAILYTFLTTRQVDHPFKVEPNETLNFEAGSVTNRRMYHFFMDLRYLFSSDHVQERLRSEDRYMMQFLDLVKLHQGICPNTRAIGEHVEYETDAWISASLITREINRLCRQFAESFRWKEGDDMSAIAKAIRLSARTVILSSLGTERKRFKAAEVKEEVSFKVVSDYELETDDPKHRVVEFVVEQQPISFHHALHYTLSWLLEDGKSMSKQQMKRLLSFTTEELFAKPKAMGIRTMPAREYSSEDYLMAAFDYPLRVCAWLAQMKAGMWVRNGMSLRHQAGTYRGVAQRDVSHHRDIFLLQTAMVFCDPSRVLASMVDRYGMEYWMKGIFEHRSQVMDDAQQLDVIEDMIHLLIIILSDRTSLVSIEEEPNPHLLAMRRDITHVLCFKPLSFSEICGKLPDKFQEQEECQDILDEMTIFKAPEGLSDVGTFELKEKFMENLDPYIAHYNKNQREESENAYKAWMAKKIGKSVENIVFEPKLQPIGSGAFSELPAFTRTGMFAQIVYYSILFCLNATSQLKLDPQLPATRLETFMQVVLHLILIAVAEDKSEENEMSEEALQSFVYIALTRSARSNFMTDKPDAKTIVSLLEIMSSREEFKACHPKITLVLKRMKQKRPRSFDTAFIRLGVPVDRISTSSPANSNADDDRQRKKLAALERQKRVMAQFQEQQKSFMDNQGDIDWGEDELSDETMDAEAEGHRNFWKYPSGTCILCQEETNESRPYGTFAMLSESRILRQTDFSDSDFVAEVLQSPSNLDHSAEHIRPFGVSGANRTTIEKINASGEKISAERQTIGKGFSSDMCRTGVVSVGCGHIMHYKCFELYYEASQRRHSHQIARHHPERLELNEFVCPLCKAQGNAFLPIIWKGKEELYPGATKPSVSFDSWLASEAAGALKRASKAAEPGSNGRIGDTQFQLVFDRYNTENIVTPLASKLEQMKADVWNVPVPLPSATTSAASSIRPGSALMSPPGAFPQDASDIASVASGQSTQSWDSPDAAMLELVNVYRRLAQTLKANNLASRHRYNEEKEKHTDPYSSDTLAEALGVSISAVEIQQRGVESSTSSTFLEKVPQQNLTHLRVLAETTVSYVTIGGLKNSGKNRAAFEYAKDADRLTVLLFVGHPEILPFENLAGTDNPFMSTASDSLLNQDTFVLLTHASLCLAPTLEIDIIHLVRLCFIAEIVKVIMLMNRAGYGYFNIIDDRAEASPFEKFCRIVKESDFSNWDEYPPSRLCESEDIARKFGDLNVCESMVEKYALVFLRKCILLLYVRYGVDFNAFRSSNAEESELNRLTQALGLPSLQQTFTDLSMAKPPNEGIFALQFMIAGWIRHFSPCNTANHMRDSLSLSTKTPTGLSLSHPVIYELVGLPKNYDTLMEETMRRRCPTTGKDVSDPMLCLFCGEIMCGQSICCLKEERVRGKQGSQIGGAQQHMRK